MRRALIILAVVALTGLLLRSARLGLAGDYVDPISKITAQDEALYASTALGMAHQGSWITPMFMGRYALYKPPLLYWLSAFSARTFGLSRLALRFPVVMIAVLGLSLVLCWAAELRTWQAGACAAVLLLSDHLWHALSAMCMTDGLLGVFYVAAMFCLFRDSRLESGIARWGFAGSVAAAILTKGVAGILPLIVLAVYWLAAPSTARPRLFSVCLVAALSLFLSAPWFVYQLAVHGRWFWTEHVAVEILGFGAGAPPQTSTETAVPFYFRRMVLTDPVLPAVALLALPGLLAALRRRAAAAVLLTAWLAVVLGTVVTWQYHNASYLLPLVPPLAILAAGYGPWVSARAARNLLVLLVVAFLAKSLVPGAPWGLSFAGGTVQPVAPAVSDYCRLGRGNPLILVGADDDLYAAALPLPRLRYALVGAAASSSSYAMDFRGMGIVVTAEQFNDLPRWQPVFRNRLREWGLDSDQPIATLILVAAPDELARMVAAHPDSDFLIPACYRAAVASSAVATHMVVDAAFQRFFLLARYSLPRNSPAWSCRL